MALPRGVWTNSAQRLIHVSYIGSASLIAGDTALDPINHIANFGCTIGLSRGEDTFNINDARVHQMYKVYPDGRVSHVALADSESYTRPYAKHVRLSS